jgi:hypothetical protein
MEREMGLQMSEKKALTQEVTTRYRAASKKEKSAILNEFVKNTGYNRKYALRVLGRKTMREVLVKVDGKTVKLKPSKRKRKVRQGKKIYTDEVVASLRLVWNFFWNKCGKILAPLLRQQMPFIADWPAFGITPEIRQKLVTISPATIDRVLKKDKAELKLRGKSCTKSTNKLKYRIPIRTFYTSAERKKPGFIQVDTVHHCGVSTGGEYLLTLTATDVYSGWVSLRGLLNKAWKWTFEALTDVRKTLPFPFLEYHSDNGSEFINESVAKWCKDEHVPFTRSRSHKKNDNCFVEQKNDKCVREYVGYDRMTTNGDLACLSAVYGSLEPLLDFFMPTMKLVSKVKTGSRDTKKYDEARSPYQRLLESKAMEQSVKDSLTKLYALYNPVILQHDVNVAVVKLRESLEAKYASKPSQK